jgi:hypothetical protein
VGGTTARHLTFSRSVHIVGGILFAVAIFVLTLLAIAAVIWAAEY